MVNPLDAITTPPGKPWPRGLFSIATPQTQVELLRKDGTEVVDFRLGADLTWSTDACSHATTLPYPCTGRSAPGPKVFDTSNWLTAEPFVVQAGFNCDRLGVYDARQHAERALAAVEQRQVEATIWKGLAGVTSLAHGAQDLTGTAFLPLVSAIGALEAALARTTGHTGVIHAPAFMGAALTAEQVASVGSDGVLRTALGTAIVLGAGYDGADPDGTVPTDGTNTGAVLYGTGPVAVYRAAKPLVNGGDPDGFSPRLNTIQAIAERGYAVAVDCPRFRIATAWPVIAVPDDNSANPLLPAPGNLAVPDATLTQTTATATWDAVPGAVSYRVDIEQTGA